MFSKTELGEIKDMIRDQLESCYRGATIPYENLANESPDKFDLEVGQTLRLQSILLKIEEVPYVTG